VCINSRQKFSIKLRVFNPIMLRRVCTVATPLRHLVFQPRTVQIARFSSAKSTQAPLDDAALRAIAITASKSQSFSDAWRCYLALPQREHITLITYNALIRAAADCGNLPSALHLLSDMISNSKLTPTQSTLASLLHACSTTCLPSLVEACVKSPKSDAPTSVSSLISVWQQLPPEAQAQVLFYTESFCFSSYTLIDGFEICTRYRTIGFSVALLDVVHGHDVSSSCSGFAARWHPLCCRMVAPCPFCCRSLSKLVIPLYLINAFIWFVSPL
jgi:pentatricopeptide repeat protein